MGLVVDYFENAYFSTFHYLVNKRLHWSERIFWAVCIVVHMSAGIYVILMLVQEYIFQHVFFHIDVDYLRFKTPFPSIILCESEAPSAKIVQLLTERFSDFQLEKGNDWVAWNNLIYYDNVQHNKLLPLSTCQQSYYQSKGITSRRNCDKEFMFRPLGNYTMYANKIRSTCDEIFTSCYYNNEEFPCCEYFLPLWSARGLCFASNNLNTYQNGSRKTELDFFLEMKIGKSVGNMSIEVKHDYLTIHYLPPSGIPSNTFDSTELYDTKKTSSPYEDIYINVKEIVADGQTIRHLRSDLRGCKYFDEAPKDVYEIYSAYACDIEALMHVQYKHCKCISHVMPTITAEKACDFLGLMCLFEKSEMIKSHYSEEIFEKHVCVQACDNLELDLVGIISENISYHFRNTDTKRTFNFIIPLPHRKFIRKCKVDNLSLIVSAGGALGLFVGCSFLSFAQIFYYLLCKPASDYTRKRSENKRITKMKQIQKKIAEERTRIQLQLLEDRIRKNIKVRLGQYKTYKK